MLPVKRTTSVPSPPVIDSPLSVVPVAAIKMSLPVPPVKASARVEELMIKPEPVTAVPLTVRVPVPPPSVTVTVKAFVDASRLLAAKASLNVKDRPPVVPEAKFAFSVSNPETFANVAVENATEVLVAEVTDKESVPRPALIESVACKNKGLETVTVSPPVPRVTASMLFPTMYVLPVFEPV